jgi:hypothetical protein
VCARSFLFPDPAPPLFRKLYFLPRYQYPALSLTGCMRIALIFLSICNFFSFLFLFSISRSRILKWDDEALPHSLRLISEMMHGRRATFPSLLLHPSLSLLPSLRLPLSLPFSLPPSLPLSFPPSLSLFFSPALHFSHVQMPTSHLPLSKPPSPFLFSSMQSPDGTVKCEIKDQRPSAALE